MKKIISVSLWGDNPRYSQGALENSKISQELFPDWTYRVYFGSSVPSSYKDCLMKEPNVEIVEIDESTNGYGEFWRFRAMFESKDNIVISRDTDTRLIEREKRCIDEWLLSDKKFSIIRDHPRHFDFPILAGMWGMRGMFDVNTFDSIKNYETTYQYGMDQLWLSQNVWRMAENNSLIHQIGNNNDWFSISRNPNDPIFIGQGYHEDGRPLYPSW